MKRRVFDVLVSAGGAVIVVVLLAAGGLAMWGYSYANSNVHNQLAQQQITFPTAAQLAHPDGKEITVAMQKTLGQYAGQQLTTGPQAKAYADDFIAVHLSNMQYNGVYSKVSAAAQANPNNAQLKALEQTTFQGTTLRGLLLEAYGFWTFGQIAFWAGIASFILAGIMALLVGIGVWHSRRVPASEELLEPTPGQHFTPSPVS